MDKFTVKRLQTVFARRLKQYTDQRFLIHLSKTDVLILMYLKTLVGKCETTLTNIRVSDFAIGRQNLISSIPRLITYGVIGNKIYNDNIITFDQERLDKLYDAYQQIDKLFRVTSAKETDYLRWLLKLDSSEISRPLDSLTNAEIISMKTKESFSCMVRDDDFVLTLLPEIHEKKHVYLSIENEIRQWQRKELIAKGMVIESLSRLG